MTKINEFKNNYNGLTKVQVRESFKKFGPNLIKKEKKTTFLNVILSVLREPMFLLLFFVTVIYFLLGEASDGIAMLVFVLFMAGINIIQEWKTDKTLESLRDLSSPKAKVIRDGKIEIINSEDIVVGDLMILEEGDKIAADAIIKETHGLGVDESTLTGESDTVFKKSNLTDDEQQDHWLKNYCYAGTTVINGSAITKVESIGLNTEYGKISEALISIEQPPTPLEKQIKKLIKGSALVGIVLFILVFGITYSRSNDLIASILSSITLAMATIPEEFPVIFTVFLAMGAWRLAKHNALIKKMPSIETLGSVSVLCVDKTGTLTKNEMTLEKLLPYSDYTEDDLINYAFFTSEEDPYDPMEKAILSYMNDRFKDEKIKPEVLFEYSFNTETKMMAHVCNIENEKVVCAKGAPESILDICNLDKDEFLKIESEQKTLASNGFRVIAIAIRKKCLNIPDKLTDNKLEFVGLLAFMDPPREETKETLQLCHKAGIRVIMITGDYPLTAMSIAKQIGLDNNDHVITGNELEKMTDAELQNNIKNTNIFARVYPKHKMRIVKSLQENAEVVAMTGDGINDAPALKAANIGIAMGKRGTQVAKEASDMILLDDNFATIIRTVKDGRRIYDNIRKAISYVFVIHIPIIIASLLSPLLGLSPLLLPIHVVLLELIIDPTCSIVFENQPIEKNIMSHKPHQPDEPLMGIGLLLKTIFQGVFISFFFFGSYVFLINNGYEVDTARTFAITVLIISNLLSVYVNQSSQELSIVSIVKSFKNSILIFTNIIIVLGLILILYTSIFNNVFKMVPLNMTHFAIAICIAITATCWWDIVKIIRLWFFPSK